MRPWLALKMQRIGARGDGLTPTLVANRLTREAQRCLRRFVVVGLGHVSYLIASDRTKEAAPIVTEITLPVDGAAPLSSRARGSRRIELKVARTAVISACSHGCNTIRRSGTHCASATTSARASASSLGLRPGSAPISRVPSPARPLARIGVNEDERGD